MESAAAAADLASVLEFIKPKLAADGAPAADVLTLEPAPPAEALKPGNWKPPAVIPGFNIEAAERMVAMSAAADVLPPWNWKPPAAPESIVFATALDAVRA